MNRPKNYDEIIKNLNEHMIIKLNKNTHKSHWIDIPLYELVTLLMFEVVELKLSICDKDYENAKYECADIANFCAFIIDKINKEYK